MTKENVIELAREVEKMILIRGASTEVSNNLKSEVNAMPNNSQEAPVVYLAGYKIEQKSGEDLIENTKSILNIEIGMISTDWGPEKHADFITDLSEFLKNRNDSLRNKK